MPTAFLPTGAARYRWYVLAVLTAVQTCHVLDRTIIMLIMEPVRAEFHLTDGQLGLLAGLAYGIAYSVAAAPLGLLADRISRRNLLAAALTIWSGLTALAGFAQNYSTLLLSRMAVGTAEAAGSSTQMSMLSDYFPARERSTAVGLWYLSSAVGTTLTFLAGGYVAQHHGWRAAFFMAGIPGFLVAMLLLATVREPQRGASDESAAAPPPAMSAMQGLRYVASRRGVLHCMAGIIVVSITMTSFAAWIASFLQREHGLPLAQAGVIAAIAFGVFGAIGGSVSGAFVDWRTRRSGGVYRPARSARMSMITVLVSAVIGVAALLVHATPLAVGLVFAYGLCFMAHNGPANSLLLSLVGPQVRGFTVSSLQIGTNLIGSGMGPFVVGAVSDRVGSLGTAMALALLLNLWAAWHFWRASRHAAADLQRLQEGHQFPPEVSLCRGSRLADSRLACLVQAVFHTRGR
ncbi:MAG: transporter [Hydrocarboniphaga sp.]|uniref:spinster family MFS transporter n=1 Tax=Hydrocarboniphaga sp. TaxID=2033016 RepID=UPI0026164441|nr:MFS transporter [Hydrocarboniphaga sp.]MDB5970644.1 transporter [Hydrocarboniphaga sp.]